VRKMCQTCLCCFLMIMATCRLVSAQVETDELFPETTQGFFSVSSVESLREQWQKTQLGTLLKDPLLKPLGEEIKKQVEANWTNRLGLSLEDLQSLPTGAISGGLIAVPGKLPGFVLVIGVNKHLNETLKFLQQIAEKLEKENVTKTTGQINDVAATIFTFPKTERSPEGGTAIYLVTKETLVITDQHHLAKLMVERLGGNLDKPLKTKGAYQTIMTQVASGAKANNATPLFKWYIEPLEFTTAIRTLSGTDKAVPKKKVPGQVDTFDLLSKHGLKELKGIGGILDLATDKYQMTYRTMFYAPQPHTGAIIRMVAFQNSDNDALPDWLPAEAARFSIVHLNPQDVFANIGPVFDDILDEPGVWNQVLEAFEKDKYRQQINIQKELIDLLGSRLILVTKYTTPVTTDSERFVAALELKPGQEEAAKKAFEKLFSSEPDAVKLERNGFTVWQSKPADKNTPEKKPSTASGNASSGKSSASIVPEKSRRPAPTPVPATSTAKAKPENSEPFFPNGALTIAHNHIFVSNNLDDLMTLLQGGTQQTKLSDAEDYKKMQSVLAELGLTKVPHFLQVFARSDEMTRQTYELIRMGEMPKSQSVLGVVMRLIMVPNEDKSSKKVEFDRSTMPEFEKIKHYFGTTGVVGITDDNGWLVEGVQLP